MTKRSNEANDSNEANEERTTPLWQAAFGLRRPLATATAEYDCAELLGWR